MSHRLRVVVWLGLALVSIPLVLLLVVSSGCDCSATGVHENCCCKQALAGIGTAGHGGQVETDRRAEPPSTATGGCRIDRRGCNSSSTPVLGYELAQGLLGSLELSSSEPPRRAAVDVQSDPRHRIPSPPEPPPPRAVA